MDVQILTLCDSAQEYNGKLVIVGAFNELAFDKFPALYPEMAVVARTIIEDEAADSHDVELSARKADTGNDALLPPLKTRLNTKGNLGQTVYSNLLLRMNNVAIPEPGKYLIKFRIDDVVKEIPFIVRDSSSPKQ